MAERQIGQLSFTDGLVNDAARADALLQRVSELVDWGAIVVWPSGLRSGSTEGAPGDPLLALFRVLLLQQWYGLSDPGRSQEKRWRTACRFGAFWPALRSVSRGPIIPRCGVFANSWPRAGWHRGPLP